MRVWDVQITRAHLIIGGCFLMFDLVCIGVSDLSAIPARSDNTSSFSANLVTIKLPAAFLNLTETVLQIIWVE